MPTGLPPSYQVAIKPVAQASRLCRRRLKPAATRNSFLKATPDKITRSRTHLPGRPDELAVPGRSWSDMPGAKQESKKIGVIPQNKGVLAEEGHY
jgi:hypothetical protein